jgi:hypothetical protein
MTEIEEMPNPRATIIIPDTCIWVCLFWYKGIDYPMCFYNQDKAHVIKMCVDSTNRDTTKPLKLYKLEY